MDRAEVLKCRPGPLNAREADALWRRYTEVLKEVQRLKLRLDMLRTGGYGTQPAMTKPCDVCAGSGFVEVGGTDNSGFPAMLECLRCRGNGRRDSARDLVDPRR